MTALVFGTAESASFETGDVVAGRYRPDGSRARMWVTVEFGLTQLSPVERETVTHERVTGGLEFSATGMEILRRSSPDCDSAGQMLYVLGDPSFEPVAPWTAADAKALHDIWRRWHLNAAKAACAHMPADWEYPQGRSPEAEEKWANRPVCPETGYRWGGAWLLDPLPEEVETRVRELARVAARSQRWLIGTGPVDR